MMNREFDNIDAFLKRKVDNSTFPINEAHWQDALSRLEEKDKKRRPLWLLWPLLLITGGVALGSLVYFQYNAPRTVVTPVHQSNAEYAVQRNITEKAEVNSAKYDEEAFSKNTTSSPLTASNKPNNIATAVRADRNHIKQQIAKGGNRNQSLHSAIPIAAKDFGTSSSPLNKATGSKTSLLKKAGVDRILQLKKDVNNGLAQHVQAPLMALNNKRPNALSNQQQIEPTVKMQTTNKVKKPVIYKSAAEMQAMNPRYVAGLEDYNFKVTVKQLDAQASAKVRARAAMKDEVAAQVKKKDPIKLIPPNQVEQDFASWFFLLGASAAKGYRGTESVNPVYGLSPNVGVGYQLPIRDNVNLYFSLYASYLNHLNINETSTRISYSFDKVVNEFTVARKNLIELHLPVTIGYQLSNKHSLLGGVGITCGLNTLSDVNDFDNTEKSNSLGYTEGLRSLDANIHMGYEYKLSKAFRINVQYQEGLFDMTSNNYFNNNQEDRNRRFSIGLRYNINRR